MIEVFNIIFNNCWRLVGEKKVGVPPPRWISRIIGVWEMGSKEYRICCVSWNQDSRKVGSDMETRKWRFHLGKSGGYGNRIWLAGKHLNLDHLPPWVRSLNFWYWWRSFDIDSSRNIMSYESARKPGLPDCLHNLKCTGSNFPDIVCHLSEAEPLIVCRAFWLGILGKLEHVHQQPPRLFKLRRSHIPPLV